MIIFMIIFGYFLIMFEGMITFKDGQDDQDYHLRKDDHL